MSDDFLDRIRDNDEELCRSYVKPVHPVAARIFFWLTLLAGAAIGVCLFLFFLTLFLYLFLPLAAVLFLWLGYQRWKWNRQWRKMEQRFYSSPDE